MTDAASATTPAQLTARAAASFAGTPDDRLRFLLEELVRHLHGYVTETGLTVDEWAAAVDFLTRAGQTCTAHRQELILLSDTLGVSMLVDLLDHTGAPGTTESTVLGPFYVPDAPERPLGSSIVEVAGPGRPARIAGRVLSSDGLPVAGALLDVWQNAANGRYAVEDPDQPDTNLRGRFHTDSGGNFSFWTLRPTDYTVPDDGPVGALLRAAARHPWRPAHVHLIVSAPGYRTVTTHWFDDESAYLDSDAVFGVKDSLICHFEPHPASQTGGASGLDEPGAPIGAGGTWYSVERDVVLAPAGS